MYRKILTYVKIMYQKLTEKVNTRPTRRTDARKKPIIIQSTPPQVIALKKFIEADFSTEKNIKKVSLEKSASVATADENLYSLFVKFILENRDGENLPPAKNIENFLGVGSTKRKKLQAQATAEGFLIQDKPNHYSINLDRNTNDLDFKEFE